MGSIFFGLFLSIGVLFASVFISRTSAIDFLNPEGLMVVLLGSIGILFTSTRFSKLRDFYHIFAHRMVRKERMALLKTELARVIHGNGNSALPPNSAHPFLNQALGWMALGITGEKLKSLLYESAQGEVLKYERASETLVSLSKYPPALGMIGTVFGIVGIFKGLQSKDGASSLGVNLAVAMTSTLYGLVLANFFISPLGELISNFAQDEELELTMIVDVMIMINENESSIYMEEKIGTYHVAS
jgi:chemotaxis protein MotA